MTALAKKPFLIPDEAQLEFRSLDRIDHPGLRGAAEYWNRLRGERRFPRREELNPSQLHSALRDVALIRVIDAGADYEYRIIGARLAEAFSISAQSLCLSAIAVHAPVTAAGLSRVYTRCVKSGKAFAVRGISGRHSETARFLHLEGLVLPMGADHVDYLLTFMVYDFTE